MNATSLLQRWLAQCQTGDVLMCHPSLSDLAGDSIVQARKDEYAVLNSVDVSRWKGVAPVRLSTLRELPHPATAPRENAIAKLLHHSNNFLVGELA